MKTLQAWSGVLVLSTAFLVAPATATTYLVEPDGTGDFPTIQSAIDAAEDGDTIELTDGTFTGVGNRDLNYLGKAITVRSQSGNPNACIIDCGLDDDDLHRGFLFISGEGPTSVLDGVTIQKGFGTAGGVLCNGASPTLTHCRISENIGAGHPGAGGMICLAGSSPTLTNCTFSDNRWDSGLNSPYTLAFDHGLSRPSRDGNGVAGGLVCYDSSSPTLTDCTFYGNIGGAMLLGSSATATLTGCTFYGNRAGSGGAMLLEATATATLTNCTFSGNIAGSGRMGAGGAMIIGGTVALTNCTFSWNVAGGAFSYGGAVYLHGSGRATLAGCTFYGNRTYGYNLGGGSMACFGNSSAALTNTIIAFSEYGEAIYCDDEGSQVTLTCCDVFGNAGGDWVGSIEDQYGINGNISEDPLFCDPENEDFTLRSDSPCVAFSPPNTKCDLIGAQPVGCDAPTGVPTGDLALATRLQGVFPNPFNPRTTIHFELARSGVASIRIYDVAGRLVRRFDLDDRPVGENSIAWNGRDQRGRIMPGGTYLVQLETPESRDATRVTLIK